MKRLILLLLLMLAACQPGMETPTIYPTDSGYKQYTINHLRERKYGGGKIELVNVMEDKGSFMRYLLRYPSDGLMIYGFADVPKGTGPFPVIIAIHGYVKTNEYQTLDYTSDIADNISREGFIVVHPNLRNYPPSDTGDNLFRVGMAVDVLNLIELVKSGTGPAELFNTAARDKIGLWGHSLGGDVVLRVLTVSSDIKAAVLYASLSGDELKNAQLMWNNTLDPDYQKEINFSPDLLENISPVNYYKYITSPVLLYHGTVDTIVPVKLAIETCTLLENARVTIHCIYFPGEDHTFRSRVSEEFYSSMLDFYKKYLSP